MNKGSQIIKQTIARMDKAILFLGIGLLLGASLGFAFTWLEDSGRIIFSSIFSSAENSGPPRVGKSAPDFELLDLEGKSIKLSNLKGQPVFINFWATWCPPCREEMPLIEEIHKQYPDLIILAVDADESSTAVKAFVQRYKITTIVLLDPGFVVNDRYYVEGLPTSYFLDADGVIRSAQIGQLSAESLAAHLAKIGVTK